jgi:hypothetical protein
MQDELTIADETAIDALRAVLARVPRRPEIWVRASENSGHVGAVLAESALQAGLNYETVVVPRVKRFIKEYPSASTVSGLLDVLRINETSVVLGIKNARKCATFRALAELLRDEGVESGTDLRTWLEGTASRPKLLRVHGVAIKTAAYMRLLTGLASIAVDVHLRRAAAEAGVRRNDADLERLYTIAAERERIPLADVDGSLWQDGSEKSRTKRSRRRKPFNQSREN